jgi:hypothetical protein
MVIQAQKLILLSQSRTAEILLPDILMISQLNFGRFFERSLSGTGSDIHDGIVE